MNNLIGIEQDPTEKKGCFFSWSSRPDRLDMNLKTNEPALK